MQNLRQACGIVANDLQDMINDIERGDYEYLLTKLESTLNYICEQANVEPTNQEGLTDA